MKLNNDNLDEEPKQLSICSTSCTSNKKSNCHHSKLTKNNLKNKLFIKNNNIINDNRSILEKSKELQKVSLLTFCKKYYFLIIMQCLSAMIFIIGVTFFIQRAKMISSGIGAIPLLINYIYEPSKPYYALMYFALNLPLIIIFWSRVKKSFIYLTFFWIIFQIFWQYIFTSISPIHDWILLQTTVLDNWNVNDPTSETWPIIYYTVVGTLIISSSIALAWKFGGSTGGTDIITYYFSTTKKIQIGLMMMIISFVISAISLIIFFTLGKLGIILSTIKYVFGISTIATIIYIFLNGFIVNQMYPKYKKVLISIYTSKLDEVCETFKKINYWHAYNIWTGVSGYTGNQTSKIETVALILESQYLIRKIKQTDPNSFIIVRNINKIFGQFITDIVD